MIKSNQIVWPCRISKQREVLVKVGEVHQVLLRVPVVLFVELLEQIEDLEIDLAVVPSRHAQITDERFDWSFVKVEHFVLLVPYCSTVRSHDFD